VYAALSIKNPKMIISKFKAVFNNKTKRMKAPYAKGQKCPDCGNAMKVRDSKKRGPVKTETGKEIMYQLRRYFCKNCIAIHTELPSDLSPYMRYQTDLIQEAIENGSENGPGVENSTINRWRTIFLAKITAAANAAKLEIKKPGEGRWLADILIKIFDSGKKHTRYTFSPSAGKG